MFCKSVPCFTNVFNTGLMTVVTPTLVGELSTVMSVSVCLWMLPMRVTLYTLFFLCHQTSCLVKVLRYLLVHSQTTRPQVRTQHPCPMPTPAVHPCHLLLACSGCSWCEVVVIGCCHVVVGREHRLSFLAGSSVRGTSVVEPGECG